jgi:hypothetical protein
MGMAAKSTGPSTLPTAANSVGECPVSPKWMKERGFDSGLMGLDLTWNADHKVALVSSGERADQC